MANDLLKYDEADLLRALSRLPMPALAAFVACCANRLVRAAAARGANVKLAVSAIENLRDFACEGTVGEAEAIEQQLLSLMPDEDEEPAFDASLLADAFAAAVYGIRCTTSSDAMNAVWSARRAYEAVDRYAGLRQNETAFTEGVETAILAHPFVQAELARQRRDLHELDHQHRDKKSVAALIERSGEESLLS